MHGRTVGRTKDRELIDMSENKASYGTSVSVCIDFDKLPRQVGTHRVEHRYFQIEDITEIIEHAKRCLIGTSGDVNIELTGYLPPMFWIEVGAFIAGMGNITYRARNGLTCKLPVASGVL